MEMLSPLLDKKTMDMFIPLIHLVEGVMKDEEEYEVLQTDLRPINNLVLDIGTLFPDQRKEDQEILKIWLQLLRNCLTDGCNLLHRYGPSQRQRRLDFVNCRPGRLLKRLKEWKLHFDYIFQGLQSEFSMFVTAHQMVNRDPTPALSAEPLCEDEAWMVFERIAFREKGAPVDIKGCARNIAEECKGFPLAIRLVAAAMRGKTTVDEWNISLSSIKNQGQQTSSSYPDTLHPQLYHLLRWCYDALPNSHIKNCFLYCAMYPKGDREIKVQELVRMWIGEGLVRSKQENHSMDMAIGRRYLNLLLDRCFFQNASTAEKIWDSNLELLGDQCIRVEDDIHEMAIYIGEKEENCLLKAGSGLKNFPTIHNHADCKRISLLHNDDIQNLPSELPCPKLVSLILSCTYSIAKVPSGFLVSLTSLKVLNLNGKYNRRINSIPSSVGQLKQLEFLSLKELYEIKELPEEMCHLPFLQFLDLYDCIYLESLPSKIGELQNLKYLSLNYCFRLKEIPHEISQLTSLTTLDLYGVPLSVEADQAEVPLSVGADQSEARSTRSIWRLKGFTNLRELRLEVLGNVAEGIMGTWLVMRHLCLRFPDYLSSSATSLPRDMKEMRKLQSFEMGNYKGSSLPDYACNFRHLENICLEWCHNLREVSPLERLPNLKCLTLFDCSGLKELGIGSSGRASQFLMLQKLVLIYLRELESIAVASSSNESVWNESTLPSLRILDIFNCPKSMRVCGMKVRYPACVSWTYLIVQN